MSNVASDARGTSSVVELLSTYGRALALVADASPAERTRALKSLALDEARFAALSAEGDAAVNRALEAKDVAQLLAFKTSFEAGRAALERERATRASAVPPPVAVPPPAAAPLPVSLSDSGIALVGSRPLVDDDEPATEKRPDVPDVPATPPQELTLMQYAALRADVLGSPDHLRPAVLARYGLTPEADLEEAARWSARFRGDRPLFDEYMRIFNYLRGLARR